MLHVSLGSICASARTFSRTAMEWRPAWCALGASSRAVHRHALPCVQSTLIDIDLYDNEIKAIPDMSGYQRLISLDLSFNRIREISGVADLSGLKSLFLINNKVRWHRGTAAVHVHTTPSRYRSPRSLVWPVCHHWRPSSWAPIDCGCEFVCAVKCQPFYSHNLRPLTVCTTFQVSSTCGWARIKSRRCRCASMRRVSFPRWHQHAHARL